MWGIAPRFAARPATAAVVRPPTMLGGAPRIVLPPSMRSSMGTPLSALFPTPPADLLRVPRPAPLIAYPPSHMLTTWPLPVMVGLDLWLRADQGVTLVSTKVSAWADLSGKGNNCTQGTDANRPTFVASATNGRPGLSFAGSHWLDGAFGSTVTIGTLFIALTQTGDGAPFEAAPVATSNTGFSLFRSGTLLARRLSGSDATIAYSTGAYKVISGQYDTSLSRNWLNTTQGTDNTSTLTLGVCANYRVGELYGAALPLTGTILEVIYYNRLLTAAEITAMQNYMIGLYNIS